MTWFRMLSGLALMILGSRAESVFAGPIVVNNGGGVFICHSETAVVPTVELFDFWEGSTFYGIQVDRSGEGSLRELVDRGSRRLLKQTEGVWRRLEREGIERDYIDTMLAVRSLARRIVEQVEPSALETPHLPIVRFIGPEVAIAPPSDLASPFRRRGCELHGAAVFQSVWSQGVDEGILWIDRTIFDLLTPVDRAGLILHEAVYAVLRWRFGVSDSVVARRLTACAFASSPCLDLEPLSGVERDGLICQSGKGKAFLLFPPPVAEARARHGDCRIQALAWEGQLVPVKIHADFPCPDGPSLDAKGRVSWSGSPAAAPLRNANGSQESVELPLRLLIGRDADSKLTVNGEPVFCVPRSAN